MLNVPILAIYDASRESDWLWHWQKNEYGSHSSAAIVTSTRVLLWCSATRDDFYKYSNLIPLISSNVCQTIVIMQQFRIETTEVWKSAGWKDGWQVRNRSKGCVNKRCLYKLDFYDPSCICTSFIRHLGFRNALVFRDKCPAPNYYCEKVTIYIYPEIFGLNWAAIDPECN